MGTKLSELIASFEKLWPLASAEEWDRPGLAIGNLQAEISKALICIDVTAAVLQEAQDKGAQLVISHHPPLLRGVSFLGEQSLKGQIVTAAIRGGIAIYSAHTNADIVEGGVSHELAKRIGIVDTAPLIATGEGIGHGRVGKLSNPMTLEEFADWLASVLPVTKAPIKVAGRLEKQVASVAIVGGAGDSFINHALAQKVDCFITSDLRHHVTLDGTTDPAIEMAMIDISHFAAESVWLEPLRSQLSKIHPDVAFHISEINTDPWSKTLVAQ
ncbi:MAG: Nif3-like dinuclear metal center hexameric protein [Actinomycetota bacterium]